MFELGSTPDGQMVKYDHIVEISSGLPAGVAAVMIMMLAVVLQRVSWQLNFVNGRSHFLPAYLFPRMRYLPAAAVLRLALVLILMAPPGSDNRGYWNTIEFHWLLVVSRRLQIPRDPPAYADHFWEASFLRKNRAPEKAIVESRHAFETWTSEAAASKCWGRGKALRRAHLTTSS